jgi:hypothetical protein
MRFNARKAIVQATKQTVQDFRAKRDNKLINLLASIDSFVRAPSL